MVHFGVAVMQGFHEILHQTVDTDVVVLAVAVVHHLAQTEQIELWIAFGCGKDFRYIPVHKMCGSLGPQRSLAFHVCHAYTGCDTVSQCPILFKLERILHKKSGRRDEFTTTYYHHNALEQIAEETEGSMEYFPMT